MFFLIVVLWIVPLLSLGSETTNGPAITLLNEHNIPIPGCRVVYLSGNRTHETFSDSSGKVFFPANGLPITEFRCECAGYPSREIDSIALASLPMAIEMKLWQGQLSEMVVGSPFEKTFGLALPGLNGVERIRMSGSQSLSKGLCFQSGLRVETNCQTCNFTQIRLNGMPGAYTQVVVNGHSIFGSLSGLYALDFFPVPIIQKINVHPGGGPLQFGGSGIGGSINLITQFPDEPFVMFSQQSEIISSESHQHHLYAAGGVPLRKPGNSVAFFFSRKDRTPYDANQDGFSEISKGQSNSGGLHAKMMHRKGSTELRVLYMHEYRRGGDRMDLPVLQTTQSEERLHHIGTIDLTQRLDIGKDLQLVWYSASQFTHRKHYTGSFGAPGQGWSMQGSEQLGTYISKQYSFFKYQLKLHVQGGVDYWYEGLKDEVPGYGYFLQQHIHQAGSYAELTMEWKNLFQLESGFRLQTHNQVKYPMPLTRWRAVYRPVRALELSLQYQSGFRGPQAFDADLHMAFAAGGVSRVRQNPNLKEENAHSVSGGLAYKTGTSAFEIGVKLTGFYTRLQHTILNEQAGTDENGNLILWKTNGPGSLVRGINLECGSKWFQILELDAGYTFQQSLLKSIWYWSDEAPGVTQMLRTPNHYGFFTLSLHPGNHFSLTIGGVFTGSMYVPHLGGSALQPQDRLFRSGFFADLNTRFRYKINLPGPSNLYLSAGCSNLLNDYQKQFDRGPERDSNFIYGPAAPRSFSVGVEWNMSFDP